MGLRTVDLSGFSASLVRTSGVFPAPSLLAQRRQVSALSGAFCSRLQVRASLPFRLRVRASRSRLRVRV